MCVPTRINNISESSIVDAVALTVRLTTMANPDVKYSSVGNEGNPFIGQHTPTLQDDELATDSDNDDIPQNSGIMIHVVPDTSKCML